MKLRFLNHLSGIIESFTPHGACLLWKPWLYLGYATADIVIAGSFFTFALIIYWFLKNRPDIIPGRQMIRVTGWIYFWCGMTHLTKVYQTWVPEYYSGLAIGLITAGISFYGAQASARVIPRRADWILSSQVDFSARLAVKDDEIRALKAQLDRGTA